MPNPPPVRLSIEGEDRTRDAWQSALRTAQSSLGKLNGFLVGTAAGIGFGAIVGKLRDVAEAGARLQSIQNALATTFGDQASQQFSIVSDAVNKYGLALESTASGYAKFMAATQGTVLEGRNAERIFQGMSKAATALGLSSDDTRGALLALGQMASKGAVQMEELKGQLGERLPGAMQLFARANGLTVAQVTKLAEQGKLGLDTLVNFGEALNDKFSEPALKASNSLRSELNRLDNNWLSLKASFADSAFARGSISALSELTQVVERLYNAANGGRTPLEIADFATRKAAIEAEIALLKQKLASPGEAKFDFAAAQSTLTALEARLDRMNRTLRRTKSEQQTIGEQNADLAIPEVVISSKDSARAEKAAADAAAAARLKYLADLKAAQDLTRTEEEKLLADIQGFLAALDKLRAAKPEDGGISEDQRNERLQEYLRGRLPKAPTVEKADEDMKKAGESFKETVRGMSVYADEAARGMQQAFSDFLFDPFRDGLKGMLRDFLNVIRRMLAEAAAAKIMEALTGGGSKTSKGGGGFFSQLLGGLLGGGGGGFGGGGGGSTPTIIKSDDLTKSLLSLKGFAAGGDVNNLSPIMVGERRAEVFWPKTPGRVLPSAGGTNVTIAPVFNTDARGATPDALRMLPALFAENNRMMVRMIREQLADDRSRGRA